MSQIKQLILVVYTPSTKLITFRVYSWNGASTARIYKDGDVPPAFSAMVDGVDGGSGAPIRTLTKNPVTDDVYIIEYNDDDGQKGVARITVQDAADGCFPENAAFGITTRYWITDTGLNIAGDEIFGAAGAGGSAYSIDGGASYKTNVSGSVIFTTSELEALGLDESIPEIIRKRVSNSCTDTVAEDFFVSEPDLLPLAATASKTDCTTVGGSDGTITLNVTGGSGTYTFLWNDADTNQNRSGLSAGSYSVTITDTVTSEEVELTIAVLDPELPSPTGSLLEVPPLNSITMLVDPIVPDGITTFQGLDNVLWEDQIHGRIEMQGYSQPVCQADIRTLQFNSDFSSHLLQLINKKTGLVAKTFDIVLKEQNVGRTESFDIVLREHTNPGETRVYFNFPNLPIPIQEGDSFEILNNAEDFNGLYLITDIGIDTDLGFQYFVITKLYDGALSTSYGTGRFAIDTVDFNVFESVMNFSDVPVGCYYLRLRAFDDDTNFKIAISEPIDLQVSHPKHVLIEYRNIDNAWDMTWTTLYVGQIRVPAIFFKRLPGGERSVARDSDFSLVKTSAKKTRGIMLETYRIPPYLHEKLSLICDLDVIVINKTQFQAPEGYADPGYENLISLSNSSIKLEQISWFRRYNSDDIATIGEQFNPGGTSDCMKRISINTAPATIVFNMLGEKQVLFVGSPVINANKILQVTGVGTAIELLFIFTLDAVRTITMPANFIMSDVRFDNATKVWTPFYGGKYKARALFDGGDWWLEITDASNT